ncbi:ArnT family glycosyltransferase [Thalassoroseus pseudoceratinae]|uniref:ArnT family glycosyltransferase n=1 Tax=Thalassoroseus pseudoceratinae TaxID=2713176 RepID=UPI0014215212|nr:glycosyltransferase family 39 protein [Thalassoroseus pseudoceratinae]
MNTAADETKTVPSPALLALAFTWVIGFVTFYVTRTIENSEKLTRLDLWKETPNAFLDTVVILCYGKLGETRIPAGWEFFGQRIGLWLLAAFVWLTAWAIGCLVMRLLGRGNTGLNIDRCERLVFTSGIGISFLSLLTLLAGLAGQLTQFMAVTLAGLVVASELICRWRSRASHRETSPAKPSKRQQPSNGRREIDARTMRRGLMLAALTPFVILMLWAAVLPSTVFDVKEYHLQGPKEWYQNGQITFLEHNVYTAFPFLTEMLSLFSMTLRGDWFTGALVGKSVLMGFVPLTGLACFASARRWCGEVAGWAAAFVYLTIPWSTTMASTAYVEGALSFFVIVSIHCGILATRQSDLRLVFITGLLAGSAMACKYPALISVVLPIGVGMIFGFVRRDETTSRLRSLVRAIGLYSLGVIITVGPWLIKNTVQTGNPVYPLAWNIFGGDFWDAERNAQWTAAHSPPEFEIGRMFVFENGRPGWLLQPIVGSNGLSVLLFALAPLAFLRLRRTSSAPWFRTVLIALSVYVAWYILSWWALTHRIDRFWIPMLPVVAVLAGIGGTWSRQKIWMVTIGIFATFTWVHHLAVAPHYGTRLPYLSDLSAARAEAARQTAGSIQFINEQIQRGELPAEISVLSVGDAEVFDAQFPIRYETVFNTSIFGTWVFDGFSNSSKTLTMKPARTIRETLADEGITHILVDWGEILRYRATYGYSPAIEPSVFDALQAADVLGSPQAIGNAGWFQISEAQRQQITELGWERHLVTPTDRGPLLVQTLLYPVR